MSQNTQLQDDRREARRKRRIKAQITAYGVVIGVILLLAVAIVVTVSKINENAKIKEQQRQEAEAQALLEEQQRLEEEANSVSENEIEEPTTEEEVVVELTREQKLDEIVNAAIDVMPLEDKVASLFIVTPESITGVNTAIKAGGGTQEALSKYAVGGIIYFKKNIQNEAQFKEMIDNTILYSKYPLFIGIDEEGGTVSRAAEAGLYPKVDSAADIAATGDPENAYIAGTTIGTYLASIGINLDFAPVADISSVENSAIGSRAYGSDPSVASPYIIRMMNGLEDSGVTSCVKHFPGVGNTSDDTHDGMAVTEQSKEGFVANEFVSFQAAIDAGANMIMVDHVSAPALTGDNTPCSLSPAVITDILRHEMGYDGVVITDALNMSAVSDYYTADEAAILAIRAGCDMVLMPEDFELAYNGVLQAVAEGTVSEERINDALRRIYRIKFADRVE